MDTIEIKVAARRILDQLLDERCKLERERQEQYRGAAGAAKLAADIGHAQATAQGVYLCEHPF